MAELHGLDELDGIVAVRDRTQEGAPSVALVSVPMYSSSGDEQGIAGRNDVFLLPDPDDVLPL
jgi:hypothetical protein